MDYKFKKWVVVVAYFDIILSMMNLLVGVFYNFIILLVLFHAEARDAILGELDSQSYSFSYPASSWMFWSTREISKGSTIMMGIIWGCTLLAIVEIIAAIHLIKCTRKLKVPKEVVRVAKWWKASNGVTLVVNFAYYLVTGFCVHPIYWLYLITETVVRYCFDKIVNKFIFEVEYQLLCVALPPCQLHGSVNNSFR